MFVDLLKICLVKFLTTSVNSDIGGEECRDFSQFMVVPNGDEERKCFEAFYDATSNDVLRMEICPVCARRKLRSEGERTSLLSNQTVVDVLGTLGDGFGGDGYPVLRHLLEIDEGSVRCWMCSDCVNALKRHTLPKLALANNLWIGDVPSQLTVLTIPEQLLIARHYPRCYIFKLYPRDYDSHLPLDQLYTGMAGNASLFELNTQEVVEMIEGQKMPSSASTLASVIAITFVGTQKLPVDWLKKTFRVRRQVVYEALTWLRSNNPIYADIHIDTAQLDELPEDDIPIEVLTTVRHEEDKDLATKERESYNMVDADDDEIDNQRMEIPTDIVEEDGELLCWIFFYR